MRGRARKNAREGQKRSGQGRERERTRREGGELEGNRGRDREGQGDAEHVHPDSNTSKHITTFHTSKRFLNPTPYTPTRIS